MRRLVFPVVAVLAVAGAFVMPGVSAKSATPSPSPSASARPKGDPCGSTKSKWAHYQCQQFNNSAPGDEYFGRTKISYLGIDNTFKDGAISAGDYTTDSKLIAKLLFADEALQRWAAKYPSDPQLARSYFLGVLVFHKVYTQPGQDTAWRYTQILIKKYPNTYFGKTAKASAANGFVEHWFAAAEPCPTPTPKGPLPKGARPQPTPEPTPEPTATPSPAPGKPFVDLLTPPCVESTPSPLPSPG